MKYIITITLLIIALFFSINSLSLKPLELQLYKDNEISYLAKTHGKDYLIYKDNHWQKTFLKGINIGSGKPGYFPGELAITKKEYKQWFKQISEMNVEVIRVYTLMKPEFYDALLEHNRFNEKRLFLMHGVWVNEDDIQQLKDPYLEDNKILNNFIKDSKQVIDAIHGNITIEPKPGHASGTYTSNVSMYNIGLILGVEWEPNFVLTTNQNNPKQSNYTGTYLYTKNSSPFEAFLAQVGDQVIAYQIDQYQTMQPLSFSNWPTTDYLNHPNEPLQGEDLVTVNMENIKTKDDFKAGLFASYHIYPYYPDFINLETKYVEYHDEFNQRNPYEAYLKDLFKGHTMPVVVAEFGVPSSRGRTHNNFVTNAHHGMLSETQQGYLNMSLLKDIYDTGYAGAILFSWQDEWFKRSWNNQDYDLKDRRAYWHDVQSSEQSFGMLAFDAGNKKPLSFVDGNIKEWSMKDFVDNQNNLRLYIKPDESHLNIMIKSKDYDYLDDEIYIGIDSLDNQGNLKTPDNIYFNRPIEFLIKLNYSEGQILVDDYYDVFKFDYGFKQQLIPFTKPTKDSSKFNEIHLALSKKLFLPLTKQTIPFESYNTGKLIKGSNNPKDVDFNSLADYHTNYQVLELRIPWQLLNVMDPSSKTIIDDFYTTNDILPKQIESINIGAKIIKKGQDHHGEIKLTKYKLPSWDIPIYHERLKDSYYIMQDAFNKIK